MSDFDTQRNAFRFYEAYVELAALADLYPEAAKVAAGFIRMRCAGEQDNPRDAAFQQAVLDFLTTAEED